MALINDNDFFKNKKVKIDYPIEWKYKVIGKDAQNILDTMEDILAHKEYEALHSNSSSTKKYISFQITVLVLNEDERISIFELLRIQECIDYVI